MFSMCHLSLSARACWVSSPPEPPHSSIFSTISLSRSRHRWVSESASEAIRSASARASSASWTQPDGKKRWLLCDKDHMNANLPEVCLSVILYIIFLKDNSTLLQSESIWVWLFLQFWPVVLVMSPMSVHLCVSVPLVAAELWSQGFPACGWSPPAGPPGDAAALLHSDWTGSLLLTYRVVGLDTNDFMREELNVFFRDTTS